MRKALLFAILFTFAVPGFGQRQKDTSPEAPTRMQKSSKSDAPKSGPERSSIIKGSTNLEAMLANTLDVRTAKVGDQVVLRTTKNVKQDGEVIIPKGSRLVGRVTEVQRKGRENAVSKLGLVFERIDGQGLNQPITASIVSIVDASARGSIADTANADVFGSAGTSATASRGTTNGGTGGGLLGGVTNTVGSTMGGVVNTAANTTNAVVDTASSTTGSAATALGGALKGISISQSVEGSANSSATLTSGEKNIRIEKGVRFNLLVSSAVDQ